jgi:hypothetical protein
MKYDTQLLSTHRTSIERFKQHIHGMNKNRYHVPYESSHATSIDCNESAL